ncbi:MAG TPA: hypothetical protein VG738_05950 [Chitinophagaceae bacterium]|nr:hypothetical protein [Chitinophagaceae bacterium]
MKHIKIMMLFVSLYSLTCFTSAHAQTLGDFRKMPAEQKAKLVTDSFNVILALTTDQYNNMYSVMLDGAQKAAPIMQGDDSRMSKGKQLKSLFEGEEAKIKTILTPAQFGLYEAKKQKAIAWYRRHWQEEKLVFNVPG